MKKVFRKAISVAVAAACSVNACLIANFATAETGVKYEFESGEINGGVIKEDSGASGGEYVFLGDSALSATVTIPVETTGMYEVFIGYSAPYGEKQEKLIINDVDQGNIGLSAEDWSEVSAGVVKLTEGDNTVSIACGWTWVNVDYVRIETAELPSISGYDTKLSDKNATSYTQSLMNYMSKQYGNHIISGQQEIYMYGPHNFEYEFEYIKNLTGETPAIRGFDYLNEANILYGSDDGTTDRIIDWVKNKNGIATASWHVTVPKNFSSYELGVTNVDWNNATYVPGETDFDTANAVIEGTKEYEYYMACLEKLAESIKELQDNDVPLIFRPLHEAEGGGGETGSWFWWGKAGSSVYKELWKLTYKTLTEDYGLHNIIWEWNSYPFETSANWYPGDEYVDLIAYDKYNCTDWSTGSPVVSYNDSAISSTYYNLVEKYNGKKMVAISENDSVPALDNLLEESAYWLYFCTWYDGATDGEADSQHINFLSNPIFNTKEALTKMYQSEYCITLDELPEDLYSDTEVPTEDPTEATGETTATTPAVTTTVTDSSVKVEGSIKKSGTDYKISFDEAIGDKVYLEFEADKSVTYANGCLGISTTYDGTDYWVAYKWVISGSGEISVDLSKPYEISYNEGEDKVEDKELTADIVAKAQKETEGLVQVWWANDSSGDSIETTNVVLVNAYILKKSATTDPTETTVSTTSTSVTTTASETTVSTDATSVSTSVTTTTTTSGGATLDVPEDAVASVLGDVNNDGKVDGTDLVALNKLLLSPLTYPLVNDTAMANADVTNDKKVSSDDAMIILSCVLGKTTL